MKKLIGYCRVSTERQKSSRNGLEAQREEIIKFAADNGYDLVEIVEESVSGKYDLDGRPVLKAAVEKCNKKKYTLVVSKLDRLSRDAAFIMCLMKTKLQFIVAELGEDISPFMLHVYCIVSEHERATIGARTKAALKAKKQREPNWNAGNPTNFDEVRVRGNNVVKEQADNNAKKVGALITGLHNSGMTLREIARTLNEAKTPTPRRTEWTAQSVSNARSRWRALSISCV